MLQKACKFICKVASGIFFFFYHLYWDWKTFLKDSDFFIKRKSKCTRFSSLSPNKPRAHPPQLFATISAFLSSPPIPQKPLRPGLVWNPSAAAAAAAKSLQLCRTLCDPIDGSPPGSRRWDSQGKNTGVGCHFLLQCMKVKSESEALSCVRLLATPRAVAHQAPPSMGFSMQEYWSGVPLPSPIPLLVSDLCSSWRSAVQNQANAW